jgi:D-alanyl-lipoteichoic acid acyltransferase DltB (MBOAT superfamily)
VGLGRRGSARGAQAWLVAASLFFYAWWDVRYLPLIVGSIVANYLLGRAIAAAGARPGRQRALLALGVAGNLGAIAWYKYAGFFAELSNVVVATRFDFEAIVLPLAISFFTFQQIAYLVDVRRTGRAEEDGLRYALFVSFFAQLIAGPIVHHREMLPQFEAPDFGRPERRGLEVGLTLFFAGLFKKVVLADGVAAYSTPVFEAVSLGALPGAAESWGAALAYTFQLYFDFSGYSDMAVGLGLLFGLRLPINFASPYRSTSIIEFWRRWHITLSRFLRDDLYIPLGGNRRGSFRRYLNLMITMLLGGLWHGAGLTFLAWGCLHGVYLLVNHGWRAVRGRDHEQRSESGSHAPRCFAPGRWLGGACTFLAVVVGWVLFRAEHFGDAWVLYQGMLGQRGMGALPGGGIEALALGGLAVVCFAAPNLYEWMQHERVALGSGGLLRPCPEALRWRPSLAWAAVMAVVAAWALLGIERYSEFLYFQF